MVRGRASTGEMMGGGKKRHEEEPGLGKGLEAGRGCGGHWEGCESGPGEKWLV